MYIFVQVAILCNHQRAVPKGHTDQMQRLADKLTTAQDELDELTLQLKVAKGKAKPSALKSPTKNLPAEDVYGPLNPELMYLQIIFLLLVQVRPGAQMFDPLCHPNTRLTLTTSSFLRVHVHFPTAVTFLHSIAARQGKSGGFKVRVCSGLVRLCSQYVSQDVSGPEMTYQSQICTHQRMALGI